MRTILKIASVIILGMAIPLTLEMLKLGVIFEGAAIIVAEVFLGISIFF